MYEILDGKINNYMNDLYKTYLLRSILNSALFKIHSVSQLKVLLLLKDYVL